MERTACLYPPEDRAAPACDWAAGEYHIRNSHGLADELAGADRRAHMLGLVLAGYGCAFVVFVLAVLLR